MWAAFENLRAEVTKAAYITTVFISDFIGFND